MTKTTMFQEAKDAVNLFIESEYVHASVSTAEVTEMIDEMLSGREELIKKLGEDGRVFKEVELGKNRELFKAEIEALTHMKGMRLRIALSLFSLSEWEENRTSQTHFISFCDVEIPAGMKVSKAIGRICRSKYFDMSDREIDEVQTRYSQVLNEAKLKGMLVLSANPADLITMSVGRNWSSCLAPGGEFGTGALAYALDTTTVVAFLISTDEKEALMNGEQVEKRWRKVLYAAKDGADAVLASKGYPFHSKELTDEAVELYNSFILEREEPLICSTYSEARTEISFRRYKSSSQIYSDVGNGNDILIYRSKEEKAKEELTRFRAGGTVKCLSCGYDTASEGSLFGYCCSGEICDSCGGHFHEDEITTTYEGDCVCEGCLDSEYVYCEDVDEFLYYEDTVAVEDSGGYSVSLSAFEALGHTCQICGTDSYYKRACDCEKEEEEEEKEEVESN